MVANAGAEESATEDKGQPARLGQTGANHHGSGISAREGGRSGDGESAVWLAGAVRKTPPSLVSPFGPADKIALSPAILFCLKRVR
jgi:hypothetical protein